MKILKYLAILVFLGILSTSIAGTYLPASGNMIEEPSIAPNLIMPRIYIPGIPKSPDYLEHYSPDNYCAQIPLHYTNQRDLVDCFKLKERWLRLNDR
tara:strand:+ start:7100 stop:7390 length:291 start_codon:yes stop_codon:yes gene_type:complete